MQTVSVEDAVAMIPDGASLLIGGFMAVGTPERIIDEIVRQRKQRLTVDYRAGLKSVAAQPEELKNLPPDVRSALKASAQRLSDATERNARMLRTAVLATQRLIQNIISIVRKETLAKPGYVNPNTAHLALGTYSPVCKPVAISRTA